MSPAFGDSNSMSLEGSNSIGGSQANLYTVPKLSADGSNWITYKERILTVAKARGLRRNFAGTARPPPASLSLIQPSAPAAAAVAGAAAGSPQAAALAAQAALAALTPEEYDKKVEEIEDKIDAYEKAEAIARQLIYSTITDALLLQVQNMATTAAIWAEVEREHQDKSEMYSSSLRTRLGQAKCHTIQQIPPTNHGGTEMIISHKAWANRAMAENIIFPQTMGGPRWKKKSCRFNPR